MERPSVKVPNIQPVVITENISLTETSDRNDDGKSSNKFKNKKE